MKYDLLLKNCRLIDGTGSPWRRADVGVKDGKIAFVGKECADSETEETVDCGDFYLAPGFIDIHSHSDTTIFDYPAAESRILQGVTTELGGDCGISAAPVSRDPEKKKLLADYVGDLTYDWNSMGEFLDAVEKVKPSVNFASAAGHGTLRIAAMGFDDRKPSEDEMKTMKELLSESLEDGAFCLSSGLIYPPGVFSATDEMAELCTVLNDYGAFYETHMRSESGEVEEAVAEAIEVAERAGVPLQICHHKILREENWGKSGATTEMIEKARERGLDVQCDQYPYCASATSLDSNAPDWAFEGGVDALLGRLKDPETRKRINEEVEKSHRGRWDKIVISSTASEKFGWTVGKSIAEIAETRGVSCADVCFDIVVDSGDRTGEINYGICEEEVEFIMKKPYVMTGSDGQAISLNYNGMPHPRNYGTFPRVIAHYARDRKLFTVEEAVRKMTAMPAARMGLSDRGLVKEGFMADLVLFDLDSLEDTPTYDRPMTACRGIKKVYVNGVLTAEEGAHTGARAGMVLRRGRKTK